MTTERYDPEFKIELAALLNRHGIEPGSNTPDYVLADYLLACLKAYEDTVWFTQEVWPQREGEPWRPELKGKETA